MELCRQLPIMNRSFIMFTVKHSNGPGFIHVSSNIYLVISWDISKNKWGMYTIISGVRMAWKSQHSSRVSTDETTKLGWSRDTFMNTYAPALPKNVSTLVCIRKALLKILTIVEGNSCCSWFQAASSIPTGLAARSRSGCFSSSTLSSCRSNL